MRKLCLIIAMATAVSCLACSGQKNEPMQKPSADAAKTASVIQQLYERQFSYIIVSSEGWVESILPDDTEGSRHQKFIVRMVNDQTLLISHNISVAPRIKDLKVNDIVKFRGEYVYNDKGGLVHWTHKSEDGKRQSGWIEHKGIRYE